MNTKYKTINKETYTDNDKAPYRPAKTENISKHKVTWQQSSKGRSVPTSRTTGVIKLRISPREMPKIAVATSTK